MVLLPLLDGEENVTRDIIRKQKAQDKKILKEEKEEVEKKMSPSRKEDVRTSVGELGLELLIANAKGAAEKACPFNAEPQQSVQAAWKKTSVGVL